MKKFTKATVAVMILLIFAAIINIIFYVLLGQDISEGRTASGRNLSAYEVMTIKTLNILNYTVGWLVCPEAAEQCWLMEHAAKNEVTLKRNFMRSTRVAVRVSEAGNNEKVIYGWDFFKMRTEAARKENIYSLAYNDAVILRGNDGAKPRLQTTAGIHECYHDPLFLFPFSLIDTKLYDKMISQGAFKNVTITYELP